MPHDNSPLDDKDFRRLIDIEQLHNKQLEKEAGGFAPRVMVKQGIFHTLVKTTSDYAAIPEDGGAKTQLQRIAHWTAANIDCDLQTGALELSLNDQATAGPWPVKDRRIVFIIQNHCEPEGDPWCKDSDPLDTDFDMYYDAIKRSSFLKKHKIQTPTQPSSIDARGLNQDLPHALEFAGYVEVVMKDGIPEFEVESTNKTPCGRTGFGFSESLA